MRNATVVLLFATLAVAACESDTTLAPDLVNVPFRLQSVNGALIPAALFDSATPPVRVDALSGAITLRPDNTFTDVTTLRQTVAGVASNRTVACDGTFASVGLVFEFTETAATPECGRTFSGVVSGSSLAASVLGVPAVFSR